jgi:hypothetical protein
MLKIMDFFEKEITNLKTITFKFVRPLFKFLKKALGIPVIFYFTHNILLEYIYIRHLLSMLYSKIFPRWYAPKIFLPLTNETKSKKSTRKKNNDNHEPHTGYFCAAKKLYWKILNVHMRLSRAILGLGSSIDRLSTFWGLKWLYSDKIFSPFFVCEWYGMCTLNYGTS